MRTRSLLAASALALAGLTLAACGGDDTASGDAAATTAAAAPETTAAAEETTTTMAAEETTTTVAETTTTVAAKDLATLVGDEVDFVQLALLLNSSGLLETLKGPGPFTVFAPTNAAFAAVGADTLNALNADPAAATPILTYHVVAGNVLSKDLTSGKVATVNGAELDVVVEGGNVTVNGAKVVQADITATNGVVHVIDAVLMPPAA